MVTTLSRAEFLRLVARGFFGALALDGLADPTAFASTMGLAALANSALKEPRAVHNAGQNGEMITRPIPKSGEKIPVIGLGTWQTFDVGNDAAALASLTEVLRLLCEGGGKVIDSSPMYGRAEAVVGDLLAKMHARDRAFL